MTSYTRGMDPEWIPPRPLIPLCPMCETRSAHRGSYCKPCRNAQQALREYWTKIGMPLAWRGPGRRRWLTVLRPQDVA